MGHHVWSIYLLYVWIYVAHAAVVTIYTGPQWTGDHIDLHVGANETEITQPIQSIKVQEGYALRLFDLPNFYESQLRLDLLQDHGDINQLLYEGLSYQVYQRDMNEKPSSNVVWLYDTLNFTGARFSLEKSPYETNLKLSTWSAQFSDGMAITIYSKPNREGIPTNFYTNSSSRIAFQSIRFNELTSVPSQQLLPDHLWLFSKPNYEGDRESYRLNSSHTSGANADSSMPYLGSNSIKIYSPHSMQIPFGYMLITYDGPLYTGSMYGWNTNISSFYDTIFIESYQIVLNENWPNLKPPINPSIELRSIVDPENQRKIPPIYLPLGFPLNGGDGYVYGSTYSSIKIPLDLALITYEGMSFTGTYTIWTNRSTFPSKIEFLSCRVVLESEIQDWLPRDPNSNQVFVYAGKNYSNEYLIVNLGMDVSYLSWLYPQFGYGDRTIGSIKIPPGLKVAGYTLPQFNGYKIEYLKNAPFILDDIQSLRVITLQDTVQDGASKDSPVVMANGVLIPVSSELHHLSFELDGKITNFTIPVGYVVVGYTKPFYMGLKYTWTNKSNYTHGIGMPTRRIRSLRVLQDIEPIQNSELNQPLVFDRLPTFYTTFYLGEANPCIPSWYSNSEYSSGYFNEFPSNLKFVWYDECLYKGKRSELSVHDNMTGIYQIFGGKLRSYLILPIDDAVETSAYAALYGVWSVHDNQGIYLSMNEEMPMLYSPWNGNINYLKISSDILVLGYDEPNFSGSCKWWTSENSTSIDEKIYVNISTWQMRSVKTINKTEWSGSHTCIVKRTTTPILVPSTHSTATSSPPERTESNDEVDLNGIEENVTKSPVSITQVSVPPANTTGDDLDLLNMPTNSVYHVPKIDKKTVLPQPVQQTSKKPEAGKTGDLTSQDSQRPMPTTEAVKTSKNPMLWIQWLVFAIVLSFVLGFVVWQQRGQHVADKTKPPLVLQWHDLDLYQLTFEEVHIQSQISAGGSGTIWLATFIDKPVAVKRILSTEEQAIQVFIDEIDLWAKLDSPNLVALVGVAWTLPTNLMAVMEYMNMGDLRTYLHSTTPSTFSWHDKLTCLYNIAQGLFYLHSSLLLHRDLKSRNVLLDTMKGTKLCDFGSSKDDAFGATMTAMVGTFRWMAPEMLLFKKYSYPVDVYSFGVVMCEIETHALPYGSRQTSDNKLMSDEQVVREVLHENLRPTLSSKCPMWYKYLALQCMSKEPSDRPVITSIMTALHFQKSELAGHDG